MNTNLAAKVNSRALPTLPQTKRSQLTETRLVLCAFAAMTLFALGIFATLNWPVVGQLWTLACLGFLLFKTIMILSGWDRSLSDSDQPIRHLPVNSQRF